MAQTSIITGQYVCIKQTAATVLQRMLAWLFDSIILSIGSIVLVFSFIPLTEQISSDATVVVAVLLAMIVICYPLIMELACDGQTIGKLIVGIKVICLDGSKPSTTASVLRFLFYLIDLTFLGVGLASIIFTRNSQRLGDLAAGTTVVRLKKKKRPFVLYSLQFTKQDYTPSYPEVVRLSMRQMEVIEHTLYSENSASRLTRLIHLARKVEEVLGIKARESDYDAFLTKVYNDFLYFSGRKEL